MSFLTQLLCVLLIAAPRGLAFAASDRSAIVASARADRSRVAVLEPAEFFSRLEAVEPHLFDSGALVDKLSAEPPAMERSLLEVLASPPGENPRSLLEGLRSWARSRQGKDGPEALRRRLDSLSRLEGIAELYRSAPADLEPLRRRLDALYEKEPREAAAVESGNYEWSGLNRNARRAVSKLTRAKFIWPNMTSSIDGARAYGAIGNLVFRWDEGEPKGRQIFDSLSLAKRRILQGSQGLPLVITAMAADPMGLFLAMDKGVVFVSEQDSKAAAARFEGTSRVFAVAARDGRLYSGAEDGKVRRYEIASRALLDAFEHVGPVHAVAVIGKYLFAASDNVLRRWDLETRQSRDVDYGRAVLSLAAHPDGKHLLTVEEGLDAVKAWDAETLSEILKTRIERGDASRMLSARMGADPSRFWAFNDDFSIRSVRAPDGFSDIPGLAKRIAREPPLPLRLDANAGKGKALSSSSARKRRRRMRPFKKPAKSPPSLAPTPPAEDLPNTESAAPVAAAETRSIVEEKGKSSGIAVKTHRLPKKVLVLRPTKLTSRLVRRMLLDDGWRRDSGKGSHQHYEHPTKPGKVTFVDNAPIGTLNSILKQAGLKRKKD